jgi:hypothetical protein
LSSEGWLFENNRRYKKIASKKYRTVSGMRGHGAASEEIPKNNSKESKKQSSLSPNQIFTLYVEQSFPVRS